jgi:hypothetical protein
MVKAMNKTMLKPILGYKKLFRCLACGKLVVRQHGLQKYCDEHRGHNYQLKKEAKIIIFGEKGANI